jgi:hypothetical protein
MDYIIIYLKVWIGLLVKTLTNNLKIRSNYKIL